MFLAVPDALIHTVSIGSGPLTIVAHGGWTGDWQLWLPPFEILSRRHRCVGFDHRGSGQSIAAPDGIRPDVLVSDLFEVLDRLGIERCVLAAESMGGLIALLAAGRDPSRFSGLVLISTGGAVGGAGVGRLIAGSRVDYRATVSAFVDACVPEPDMDHVKAWGRRILLQSNGEAAARLLESSLGVVPDPSIVAVPVLMIQGRQDAIVDVAAAEALAASLPRAELIVLDDAGHVPTMTRPDVVAELIEDWLARVGLA